MTDRVEGRDPKAATSGQGFALTLEQARQSVHRLWSRFQHDVGGLADEDVSPLALANEQLVLSTLRAQVEAEEAARALEVMSRSAEHDALTELPNRVLLHDRLARAIADAKRHRVQLALLFLDIDKFKEINDSLGHAAGDLVLQRAAGCLVSSVRGADTVCRYGGDEFIILLTEMSQASDVVLVARKVIDALGSATHFGDQVLRLTASIGISIYPEDGEDAETLINRADAAMYRAKGRGLGGFAFHGSAAADEPSRRAASESTPSRAHPALDPMGYERRNAQLRAANERLVVAALEAQDRQARAEAALRRRTTWADAPRPNSPTARSVGPE